MGQEHHVLYHFGPVRPCYLLCLMSKTKPRLGMRTSCLCWPAVIKFILLRVCLEEGASRRLITFAHSKKVLVQASIVVPVIGADEFLKAWD